MDQEKIQQQRDEQKRLAERQQELDSLNDVRKAVLFTGLTQQITNQPVTVTNPGASSEDVTKLARVVDDLNKGSSVNQKKTIKQLEVLNKQIKQLPTQYPSLPTFPKIPIPPDQVTVKNFKEVTDWLERVVKKISDLKLDPKIEVKPPEVNVPETVVNIPETDLRPLLEAIKKIDVKPDITIPDQSAAFQKLEKAVEGVTKSISSLRFPVANYVLPFKDSSGKAVQAQLDTRGNVPTLPKNGMLPFEYDDLKFTNPNGNGNYQTITAKSNSATVAILTLQYDSSDKVISIVRN